MLRITIKEPRASRGELCAAEFRKALKRIKPKRPKKPKSKQRKQ